MQQSVVALIVALAIPFLLAKPAKNLKSLDAVVVFELLKQGKQLSPSAAEALEKELAAKPDDPSSRIELLSYYANQTKVADWPAVRAARLAHILWFIERDAKDGFGLFQVSTGVYRLHCQGDDLADPAGLERVAQAWLGQIDKHPKDDSIFRQTIGAIQYCKPETAEKMLIARRDQSGLGQLYSNAVLGLNGEGYASYDPAASLAELRRSEFALRAAKILDNATDPKLLEAAATTMLVTGAEMWADGKLDWDFTPLGLKLLTMARAAGAHSQKMLTLPMTLPQRGERPPPMLRVGGNIQAKNLVRKVTPRYPLAAREQRISGTVRMLALIGLNGAILDLEVVSGPPELIDASLEAARQWLYRPTLLNGKPCYIQTQLDINYEIR